LVGTTNFLREGCRESRRCSRDTYPESCITKYTSIRRYNLLRCAIPPVVVAQRSDAARDCPPAHTAGPGHLMSSCPDIKTGGRLMSSCQSRYSVAGLVKHIPAVVGAQRSDAARDRPPPHASVRGIIRMSICDKYSGSIKITTHLDHISHCKEISGTNLSNRWTYRLFIINTRSAATRRATARRRTPLHPDLTISLTSLTRVIHLVRPTCHAISGEWST